MFRIGRISDLVTTAERRKMEEVQAIFRKAFRGVVEYADRIPELLVAHDSSFEFVVLTAENARDQVLGFALLHLYSDLKFAYLDYIAIEPGRRASGIGGALYEAVREYASRKGARGLFMDVPPDDPALVRDPAVLPQNAQRLRFYEQYGAFPIVGTSYETLPPGAAPYDPPHLVYDPLGNSAPLRRDEARRVVEAIFVRKYKWDAQHPYVRGVVASFTDDPVRCRAPRYVRRSSWSAPAHGRLRPLKVVVAKHHEIHHVRERGYVERPVRVEAILKGLAPLPIERRAARHYDDKPIRAVHDKDFVSYLAEACRNLGPKETVYPYIFPIRYPERKPKDRAIRAGYYCIDTFTPLSRAAYEAARSAVDCAVTGADMLVQGEYLVYALCRPPGHHAERGVYGGFCYFSNAAIAAHRLSAKGKVAVLDIDFHHGNGSQDIFYLRDDVFVASIHGDPDYAYPYFSGFADERGQGAGLGFNLNIPLPENVSDEKYLKALSKALKEIRDFRPAHLVISLGFDIMRGDPTGSFLISTKGLERIGEAISRMELPTLVVQEGGYSIRNLTRGAQAFFTGLCHGWFD